MSHHTEQPASPVMPTTKDPVCGMDVDLTAGLHVNEYNGQEWHFCSGSCKATFEADPEAHCGAGAWQPHDMADHPRQVATPASDDVAEWTCPMHPEIRRPGPGPCPICGM